MEMILMLVRDEHDVGMFELVVLFDGIEARIRQDAALFAVRSFDVYDHTAVFELLDVHENMVSG